MTGLAEHPRPSALERLGALRPSRRLVRAGAALLVLGIVVAIFPVLGPLFLPAALTLLAAAGFDALRPAWRRPLSAQRRVAESVPVGVPTRVELTLENERDEARDVLVYDGPPESFGFSDLPQRTVVEARSGVTLAYDVRPTRRGAAVFRPVELLSLSPFGLWEHRQRLALPTHVRVLPNHRPVVRYHVLAVAHRIQQMSARRRNRRGLSTAFHQLREYRDGDLPQQIDWKATSRRRALISREYEEERDQRVVLLVDRGRRMAALDDEVSLLDHALNASLLLTYVALRQGDQVGLVGFSGPLTWLPPVKGAGGMPRILHGLHDWQTTDAPSDYLEAAQRTLLLERRRALVVLLTSVRGEDSAELVRAAETLSRRHLVVVASLREPAVSKLAETEVEDVDGALAAAGAAHYEAEREALCAELRSRGVRVLDVLPDELPAELASAYLDVKMAGAL